MSVTNATIDRFLAARATNGGMPGDADPERSEDPFCGWSQQEINLYEWEQELKALLERRSNAEADCEGRRITKSQKKSMADIEAQIKKLKETIAWYRELMD